MLPLVAVDERFCQALLCNGIDVELSTETGAVLEPRLTSLSYPLLVHGDLSAPVARSRLRS